MVVIFRFDHVVGVSKDIGSIDWGGLLKKIYPRGEISNARIAKPPDTYNLASYEYLVVYESYGEKGEVVFVIFEVPEFSKR